MSNHSKKLTVLSLLLLATLLLVALPQMASSANPVGQFLPTPVAPEPYPFSDRYPAVVYLDSLASLQTLYRLEIDFEGLQVVSGGQHKAGEGFQPALATVYINPDESEQLAQAGLTAIPIPNEGLRSFYEYGPGSDAPNAWPTFQQFVDRMQGLENNYPALADLISIGQSVQGRDIWCLKISDNVSLEENEPEFKYSSTVHGDETTGIELTIRLAELLLQNYDIDPDLTELVNEIEIWLCPIHNPDGYVSSSRYNAHGYDINREFPDRFTDPIDDPAGHEPETQAFMYFGYGQRFVMGANYHGGAQVLNYPWDAVAAPGDPIIPDYAPDDNLFHDLGLGYTILNPMIHDNPEFPPDGLTRGWEWYQIWGGMQDWAYYWRGEHHVTIEVSNTKRPPYEQMDYYWDNNQEAMVWWLASSLSGVRGQVLDARDGSPLNATITVDGMEIPNFARTDPSVGDYHRVISAGDYTLTAAATGYQNLSHPVTVVDLVATSQDFLLCPTATWNVSGRVTQVCTGAPLEATLEFLPSPQVTTSSSLTGNYSIEICPGEYTIRVSAPYHLPQERQVVVDQDLVEDFILDTDGLGPDMSSSTKQVSAEEALPGDILQYQIVLLNTGEPTTATLTDTLPLSITWTGELTASQGVPSYDNGQILWQGSLGQCTAVTVTYTASVNQCLAEGVQLTNTAVIQDHLGAELERTAVVSVTNQSPGAPELLSPEDGAMDQPQQISLSWSASSDINCDVLTYDVYFGTSDPPPLAASGLVETAYTPLDLLQAHTTYYWSVSVSDGISQSQSTTWQFTTLNNAPDSPIPVYPPDGSLEIPTSLVLSWSGSDPDNDVLTYSLVFWADGTQPVTVTNLTETLFDPGLLTPGVTYYWQITVSDGLDTTIGEVWNFTTQPLNIYQIYLPLARKTSNQEP